MPKMLPPPEVHDYPQDLKAQFWAACRSYEDAHTASRDEQIAAQDAIFAVMNEARRRRAN